MGCRLGRDSIWVLHEGMVRWEWKEFADRQISCRLFTFTRPERVTPCAMGITKGHTPWNQLTSTNSPPDGRTHRAHAGSAWHLGGQPIARLSTARPGKRTIQHISRCTVMLCVDTRFKPADGARVPSGKHLSEVPRRAV